MQQGQTGLEHLPFYKVLYDGVSLLNMLKPDSICLKSGILKQLNPVRPVERTNDNQLRQSKESKIDTMLPPNRRQARQSLTRAC